MTSCRNELPASFPSPRTCTQVTLTQQCTSCVTLQGTPRLQTFSAAIYHHQNLTYQPLLLVINKSHSKSHKLGGPHDPTEALLCSHVADILPSSDSNLIVAIVAAIRFPKCTTQLSTKIFVPIAAGLRYVQLTIQGYQHSKQTDGFCNRSDNLLTDGMLATAIRHW